MVLSGSSVEEPALQGNTMVGKKVLILCPTDIVVPASHAVVAAAASAAVAVAVVITSTHRPLLSRQLIART